MCSVRHFLVGCVIFGLTIYAFGADVILNEYNAVDDWQFRIRDAGGDVVFGPAGEGISPASGIVIRRYLAVLADTWLGCGNPYDPGCQ